MSDDAIAWAPAQETGSPRIKALLIALAPFVQADGTVWAKVDMLALKMDCADRTVQRSIQSAIAAKWLESTPDTHLYEGKLYPLYKLPLERGPANMRARLEIEKARASGDRMSPQELVGCQSVTPTGDRVSPLEVTECHPTILRETKKEEDEVCLGARGAQDEAFGKLDAAWIAVAPSRSDQPKSRTAFEAACDDGDDPALILAAGLRYLAESRDAKAGRAPLLHNWLGGKRWRGFEPKAAEDAASARPRFAVSAADGAPLAFRLAVRLEQLNGCGWDEAERAILTTTNFYAERLQRDLRRQLAEHNITVIARKP